MVMVPGVEAQRPGSWKSTVDAKVDAMISDLTYLGTQLYK